MVYSTPAVLCFPPVVVLYFGEQISESSLLDRSGVSLESKPFIGVALFKCPADGTLEGWPVPLYLCTLYLVPLYLGPLLHLGRVPALYLHQICLQCRVQWCSLDGSFRPKCVSWQWVVSEGLQPVRFQDIWHHQPPAAQKYCTAQMAYFHYFHFHWSPPIWQHFQRFTFLPRCVKISIKHAHIYLNTSMSYSYSND